jgi:PBP1b-binding outer membrane lipoprotein LpoB
MLGAINQEASMRKMISIFALGLFFAGCSKTDEMTDKAASNLVRRIQSPINQARAVSEKAAAQTRAAQD